MCQAVFDQILVKFYSQKQQICVLPPLWRLVSDVHSLSWARWKKPCFASWGTTKSVINSFSERCGSLYVKILDKKEYATLIGFLYGCRNIRFLFFVIRHACAGTDGRTDRISTTKTSLAYNGTVKWFSCSIYCTIFRSCKRILMKGTMFKGCMDCW